jgi:hypothetical protein
MEMPLGKSLCSYLKQTKISYFLLLFFLYIIGELEGRTHPAWEGWYQWEGDEVQKL